MEFDRYHEGYSDRINRAITFGNAEQDFYLRAKAAHILRLVEQQLRTDKPRILDVGCGIGLVHSLLEPHVKDLVGVDVAPQTLAEARRGAPVGRFVRYDGAHLPFPDKSFACVDYAWQEGMEVPDNLVGLRFREQEGCYLVGAIAGLLTETDVVGFVGGMENALIKKFDKPSKKKK